MRRFAPLALLLAASSIVAVSSAQPNVAPAVDSLKRADLAHPWVLRGDLTPTSSAAPLSIAIDALRRHATWATKLDLVHVDTAKLPMGGDVVTFQQTIGGVPVLHRGVRVTIESDGRATALSTTLEENRPLSMLPAITEKAALAEAARLGVPANELGARLLILPNGSQPTLVWAVVGDLGALPTRPVVLLDAQTGDVALAYDAAKSLNKAKVHLNNPIKTPDLTEVTLTNTSTTLGLDNAVVKALNCIDHKTTKTVNFGIALTVHVCELEPTITPDTNGDYVSIAPEKGAPEDKYAELSMFYHTNKAYEFVRAVGFPDSKVVKISAVANLRIPQGMNSFDTAKMANPDLPLAPFDNAFFAEKDPLLSPTFGLDGDAMWFGQGTLADFGYDGDVVYHEFGHFVVSRSIKLGGGTWADEYGLSYSPGGLNEGIADIISFFVTDDPELGEYTTLGLGLPAGKGLRSATNTFKFPEAITGEVHQDSEPVTAAVWAVYGKLDATKKLAFQKAFMKTLLTAPQGNLGYDDFAELVIKDVSEGVDAASGTALRAAFDERGIKKGDPRVRTYTDAPISSIDPRLGIHAPGKSDMVNGTKAELVPGLFQIAYDAPAGGVTKIHVSYNLLTRGGAFGSGTGGAFGGSSGTPYTPALLVKTGGEPIKFTYGPLAHDATGAADCVVATDKKSATCDIDVELGGKWGETSKVHLMLVNKGSQGGDFDAVTLSAEGPPEPPPEQPAAQPTTTTETTTSCGCTIPGATSNGTAATFALGALGLMLASRRRK